MNRSSHLSNKSLFDLYGTVLERVESGGSVEGGGERRGAEKQGIAQVVASKARWVRGKAKRVVGIALAPEKAVSPRRRPLSILVQRWLLPSCLYRPQSRNFRTNIDFQK